MPLKFHVTLWSYILQEVKSLFSHLQVSEKPGLAEASSFATFLHKKLE